MVLVSTFLSNVGISWLPTPYLGFVSSSDTRARDAFLRLPLTVGTLAPAAGVLGPLLAIALLDSATGRGVGYGEGIFAFPMVLLLLLRIAASVSRALSGIFM
jgi:hypothetical protein